MSWPMRVATTVALCAALLCGCSTAGRYVVSDIDGGTWDSPVTLEIPNSDTTGLYDIRIALRHNGLPVGTTVAMNIRTVTPDSLWTDEQLTLTVRDDGRSRSSQHEAGCTYRRRVRFGSEGRYRMIVTPQRALRGVTAIGVEMTPEGENE